MFGNGTNRRSRDSTGARKPASEIAGIRGEGSQIAKVAATHVGPSGAGLSLLFASGARPTAGDIERLAAAGPRDGALAAFSLSHRPDEVEGWLELLASGLTFDLTGLNPARAMPPPPFGTSIGMPLADQDLEPITLVSGPHLAGGEALLPIVRVHAGLGATLAMLPAVEAVAWHPARTWIEPAYFVRTVAAWLAGGAFPALGLTALARGEDGTLTSEGLAFFAGRELRVPPGVFEDDAENAKLAIRLIHHIVEAGRDAAFDRVVTEQGLALAFGESRDGRFLEVRRSEA